jgi:hypothetical protein
MYINFLSGIPKTVCHLLLAGYLLSLILYPEDRGSMFFLNAGKLLPNYGALHARTQYISWGDNIKMYGCQVGYEAGNWFI